MCESGIHEIGADAFDLSDDVAFAGECHGDDENDTAATDNDAEHRQPSPEFIRPERLKREMKGLVPIFGFVSHV